MECTVGIGLLGCGTVGGTLAERLILERDALAHSSGAQYELRAIAVADPVKTRRAAIDRSLLTSDARGVVDDPRIDIIVECIGGTSDAAEPIERALDRGRHVVSANKDLLATQGPRLRALAALRRADLRYEAAACGAVPVVRVLGESLAGDRVDAISGVLNGTCTSILSAMEAGAEYGDALAHAQSLGYAESDPSSDVDGDDAAHKLALLIQIAFGLAVISPRIKRSGIRDVTKREVARAKMLGYRIRHVAAAVRSASGLFAETGAVLVDASHPFALAAGPENVVRIAARDAGLLELRGPGAGGAATASALLGDVVSTLRTISERHDVAPHARSRALHPAIDVSPFFADFPRHPDIPRFAVWDERYFQSLSNAPASREGAYSLPGKERTS